MLWLHKSMVALIACESLRLAKEVYTGGLEIKEAAGAFGPN
jgi:hypothetical protein